MPEGGDAGTQWPVAPTGAGPLSLLEETGATQGCGAGVGGLAPATAAVVG